MNWQTFLMATVVAAAVRPAYPAADNRVAVDVMATTPDQVGMRLAYQLREQLARSSVFRQQVPDDKTYVVMSLITLDAESDARQLGRVTTYSFAVLWAISRRGARLSLGHSVGTCGGGIVASCAETLLAEMAVKYEEFVRIK